MDELRATVVIPTTGDRGPLLPHSVGSVLAQTVDDLEVIVIGDGIDESTREVIAELVRRDERVRCFEFPKDSRRGELNRHAVLTEHARGRIVTYLCDRDLYLPRHVEVMDEILTDADFGYTFRFRIGEDGTLTANTSIDLTLASERRRHRWSQTLLPLSFAGHTMDAYRRLPHGWRTTPPDTNTDRYMFEQFLDQPWCRVGTRRRPTVLTFKRGDHPGWSTEQRRQELERWSPRLADPSTVTDITEQLLEVVDRDRGRLLARLRGKTAGGIARQVLPEPVRRTMGRLPVRRLRRIS